MLARKRSLAAIVGAGLLLTGCASTMARPAGYASPQDGKQALITATAALAEGNYSFSRTGGGTVEGTVRLPDAASLTMSGGIDLSMVRTGTDHYLRLDMFEGRAKKVKQRFEKVLATSKDKAERRQARYYLKYLPVLSGERWSHLDEARMTALPLPTMPSPQRPDVTGATALVGGVTSAQRTGDTIVGTIDATKVDPELSLFRAEPVEDFLGAKAKSIPFTATLDAQGRLVNMTVEVPDVALSPSAAAENPTPDPSAEPMFKGFRLIIKIADYGSATAPSAPPRNLTTEVNDELYAGLQRIGE